MIPLSHLEQQKLINGIRAAYAIPFIDDVTSFIWEAIFSYVKGIPIVDPLSNTRSKKLYDVVDHHNHIGWSAKALQKGGSLRTPFEFELVIQRADIFKKAHELGFPPLTEETNPQILGNALLEHWRRKVDNDAIQQTVASKRVCILIKSNNRTEYIYYEDAIKQYHSDEIRWSWTNRSKAGLQGARIRDDFVVYRWYKGQKQFFERFQVPQNTNVINLQPVRLPLDETVEYLRNLLNNV